MDHDDALTPPARSTRTQSTTAETTAAETSPVVTPDSTTIDKPRKIRVWPGLLLAGAYWALNLRLGFFELPTGTSFLSRAGGCALLVLLFPIWWLTNGTVRLADRLWVFLALIVGASAASVVSLNTMTVFGVLFGGLPAAFGLWALALLALRRFSPQHVRAGLIAVLSLNWFYFTLIRMDGISGDLQPDIRWRWSPREEDAYLAERAEQPSDAAAVDSQRTIEPRPGDWTIYRGPNRNGEVRGLEISTDWNASPPQLVWKQRIGPGWSSMLVIDGRLYTQEQVGESEAVVCLDAETGRRIWSHEDQARFWDSQSGAGPRATPAFDGGRIYAQGATGILNCLDAATGELQWSRDIMKESSAPLPHWGFCSTPLVSEGLVITFAGGPSGKGLLAYRADDGELAWTAATGPADAASPPIGYASAQPVEIDGKRLALYLSNVGLTAIEPQTGAVAWEYEASTPGVWRAVQPALLGDGGVLIGSGDLGLVCLDVARSESGWTAKKSWAARSMKPEYNDFVIRDGQAYGLDVGIFCCVDLADGKRQWKKGRYGHGQVLLLADQGLLLVTCESGEVVLLEATPKAHRELGRFAAIEGKTWNHPAIAQGCLFVRNDEQIACYRLQAAAGAAAETAP